VSSPGYWLTSISERSIPKQESFSWLALKHLRVFKSGVLTVTRLSIRVQANSALLSDTYTSPLRAQRGAAKRGR